MNWDYLAELDLASKTLTPLRSGISICSRRIAHGASSGLRLREQRIHVRPL